MNKSQKKQFEMVKMYMANSMQDTAARGLSAMIRAAMTGTSRAALMLAAEDLKLTNNPEFLI